MVDGSTTVTVEQPHMMERKTVDASGRIYVGTDLAGEEVQLVVADVETPEDVEDSEE